MLAGGIPQTRKPVSETVETVTPVEDDDILALSEEVANDDRPVATLPAAARYCADARPSRIRQSHQPAERLRSGKVAADQARILKEREREERPEGGLTKTERNAFREIADRLRKQGLASSRSTSEAGALSEEAVAGSPQPVAVEEAALHIPSPAHGDETALLANLPVPVIIHSGDTIHYVNQALLDLTGYESLDDIRGAGGVDVLFNSESDDGETRQGMVLRRADGSEEPVDAHLNAIAWRDGRALMLSLMPVAAPQHPRRSKPLPLRLKRRWRWTRMKKSKRWPIMSRN